MNQIIPFNFENRAVRAVMIDGVEWWVGKDVCVSLGYTNPNKAMGDHCKGVTKRYPLETPGGIQELRIINEPDVFRLIANSRLPQAQRFEKWLFEVVLPQIRKSGSFSPTGSDQTDTTRLRTENRDLREIIRLYREKDLLYKELAHKGSRINETEIRQITVLSKEWTVKKIAEYINRDESTVRRVLAKRGGAV